MESKQYISKQPTAYWKNQKWNKKIFRNKWQWKHDNSKSMECSKSSSKGEFIAIQSYLKKQEKHWIDYLTFPHKTTVKRRTKKPPKLVEGKKS